MIIQDVIDLAKYSELSGSSLKDNNDAILLFINAGMLELHKRFQLKTNEHIVNLQEGVTLYSLPEDFLYAIEAFGEVREGYSGLPHLPINDEDEPYSIFFPNHKEVQVPLVEYGASISIIYGAKPIRYDIDDLAEELDLPETLIEALLHYIGYKAHLGIKGDAQSENNAHYIRFDRSCKKARELGVAHPIDSWRMVDRLNSRGFV